jgi:hypothetical protein
MGLRHELKLIAEKPPHINGGIAGAAVIRNSGFQFINPIAMKHISHLSPVKPVSGYYNAICLGLAAILLLLAPSGDSFWIDEANSANMALQPGLASWWQAVTQIASDVQMSPYFLQLWGWQRLAGSSEWGLRLDNLPWIILGIGAWFLALPRSMRGTFALLAGVSPFLWYYANEIRPYAMLFGASSLMFAALFRCARAGISKSRLLGVGVGALFAMGASSAALPWVGITFLVILGLLWNQKSDRSSTPPLPSGLLGTALLLVLPAAGLAGLYLWSFSHGARASSPEPSNLGSLMFVPYELLGFTGLGPGRTELRAFGIGSIKRYLPLLALLGCSMIPVIWAALCSIRARIGTLRLLAMVGIYAVPMIAVAGLGWMTGLRTTGRHFTPALGLILPLLALGVHSLWNRKSRGRVAVVCLFLCWMVSSIQIRVAARHKKDNYREAARIARGALESGHSVWWVADSCGAKYYGVALSETPQPGTALTVHNLEKAPGERPDVVVLSRPDVYDSNNIVGGMLSHSDFQLKDSIQSFTIWEKAATP